LSFAIFAPDLFLQIFRKLDCLRLTVGRCADIICVSGVSQQQQQKDETMTIRFKLNKNGKRIAHYWSMPCMRWFPISVEKAELLIATGQAEQADSNAY